MELKLMLSHCPDTLKMKYFAPDRLGLKEIKLCYNQPDNGTNLGNHSDNDVSVLVNIVHLNVCSLRNKANSLDCFIQSLNQPDIIALSEHWMVKEELPFYTLDGYTLVSDYCRDVNEHGGVLLWSRRDVQAVAVSHINLLSLKKDCEVASIKLVDSGMIVIVIYRSPTGNLSIFFENFHKLLSCLEHSKNVVITGDFNINFLEMNNNCRAPTGTSQFLVREKMKFSEMNLERENLMV